MNLTLPRYMINKERRGNVEYTIPRPYPDICFIVNVWDVPILTHPRNNFRENSVSAWVGSIFGKCVMSIKTCGITKNNTKVLQFMYNSL